MFWAPPPAVAAGGAAALYVAISQVLAQPADKYNVDFAGVRARPITA